MPSRPSIRSPLKLLLVASLASLASACSTEPEDIPGGVVRPDGGTPDGVAPPPPPPPDGSPPPIGCKKADDCPSKVCDVVTGKCAAATCKDGVKNGDETDSDCGGPACPKCDIQKTCKGASDCVSGVCTAFQCRAPTCSDAVQNAAETDVDCGGPTCGKCDVGKKCGARGDCKSDVCTGGKCVVASCTDGARNGTETGVDCGGPACPRCDVGQGCLGVDDCVTEICEDKGAGLQCQAPSCTDGLKNGSEVGVDCGGPACPGCGPGEPCITGADCASGGCNYMNVCAGSRSCTAHYGGDTCGLGGAGGVGPEAWEDCCVKEPITAAGAAVMLDKYQVTAGRMRVFLESVGYDVRGFVQSARAAAAIPPLPGVAGRTVLDPAWDMYLPVSFAGNSNPGELAGCAQRDFVGGACLPGTAQTGIYTAVSRHLGGFIFQQNAQTSTGCYVGSPGTHSFRFPAGQQDGDPPEHSQDVYDTKPMQCIDYLVAQAFCVWDGGRLETLAEWQAANGPGPRPWSPGINAVPKGQGSSTYWGCRFPWITDADHGACPITWAPPQSIEYASFQYSYEYPRLGSVDYIVFMSAPGRTLGRGPAGHADLFANVFELTSTVTYNPNPILARHRWSGNGSWEGHGYNRAGGGNTMLLNKYGKLGLRCAYP